LNIYHKPFNDIYSKYCTIVFGTFLVFLISLFIFVVTFFLTADTRHWQKSEHTAFLFLFYSHFAISLINNEFFWVGNCFLLVFKVPFLHNLVVMDLVKQVFECLMNTFVCKCWCLDKWCSFQPIKILFLQYFFLLFQVLLIANYYLFRHIC